MGCHGHLPWETGIVTEFSVPCPIPVLRVIRMGNISYKTTADKRVPQIYGGFILFFVKLDAEKFLVSVHQFSEILN